MGAEWFSRSDSPNVGYRYPVDLLPALKREDSHGTAPLGWDIRVCASFDGCSWLESASPTELNDARLGQAAVTAIPQRGSYG